MSDLERRADIPVRYYIPNGGLENSHRLEKIVV